VTTPPIPKGDKARIAKLATVAQTLRDGSETYFSTTKLTSLKSLCKEPQTANHFVFYLAQRTQVKMETVPRSNYTSEIDWNLYQSLIADAVSAMGNYLENPTGGNKVALQQLRNQVRATQDEQRRVGWNTVRTIHSPEVLIIEYALECMLSPQFAPDYAYRAGRHYTERYEPRYGTGLIPASAPMLADIVQFWHGYYNL
jgi:hypothetical protein